MNYCTQTPRKGPKGHKPRLGSTLGLKDGQLRRQPHPRHRFIRQVLGRSRDVAGVTSIPYRTVLRKLRSTIGLFRKRLSIIRQISQAGQGTRLKYALQLQYCIDPVPQQTGRFNRSNSELSDIFASSHNIMADRETLPVEAEYCDQSTTS